MTKESKAHENYIADIYSGLRSPSSGAADNDGGDVRAVEDGTLFECKVAGTPTSPKRSTITKHMEKIADEAWMEGREPALALRYFDPTSPIALNGWVDLVVRLARDDAMRSAERAESRGDQAF